MSSCAASCCICFPKASSAFVTLASSPTGGAPLSCRFAFNYSAPYSHRRPNHKPPLPRSNSVLLPLSPESPHDTTIPISLTRCSPHLPPWCALLAPKPATRFQPRLKLSPRPHANYNQTNPASPLLSSTTSSRIVSHHPNTIQFA